MIEGRLIVCIGSAWDYDPTGKHQIMRILSRRNHILWINYHGSRRPTVTRGDLRHACTTLCRTTHGLRRASPSIFQMTPLVVPGARHRAVHWIHRNLLVRQIRRAVRKLNRCDALPVQLWSFAPDVPYLCGAFDEECSLYYCVDDYTRFEGYASDWITAAENQLLDRADVVLTSSTKLLEAKRLRRPDALLVGHGVDYDHFASAWRSSWALPADLAPVPRPIFGFFGLLHHWIDLALIAEVARMRPLYSFVLLGECKTDVSELATLDNVVLLGRRAYEDLPAYCSAFDGAMLPFRRTEMTASINPIKMYEYLAAGLPVVSTRLPEAQRFAGAIRIADNAEQFASACDDIVASEGGRDRAAISRLVAGETWEAKVEQLSAIVSRRTEPIPEPFSKPRADVGPWSRPAREPIAVP